MFKKFALTALFASATLLAVSADVVPTVPGPGIVYREGETCHIEWAGDAVSTTAWKGMAIELMTGSNFEMVHLTTVATDLDGTVSGSFDHPCPAVVPNSAIYFYQFTAPGAGEKQWTTRFTIASATGAITPPTNPTQPGTNEAIPWGTGALADSSTAVPPPPSASGATGSGAPPVSSGPSSSSSLPLPSTTELALSSTSVIETVTSTSRIATFNSAGLGSSAAALPLSTANTTAGTPAKENAAGSISMGSCLWQAAVALGASAVASMVLL